ncbi:CaiB/BaiF CoA transferase family protein [Bacillus sp. FJAT-45037]|uniref:CaiB/BaiF CoA transferase family protein n=1 Tax=Bacillus sp. FJAT-45037 TaxID=2011007 RepID=UPI000C24AF46|nr:CoA transferase [Bacillus sp. FJAT-45037]
MKKQLLSSISVIDFTNYLPGPYATLRLADMGATVTKVEPPNGDPAKSLSTMYEGEGVIYAATNWNKQSINRNLKEGVDRQDVLDRILRADVVIESFRPGVMKKLGLDYQTLKNLHPSLIYCSISGYGQATHFKQGFGSHDLNYMADAGFLSLMTDDSGRPIHAKIQYADYLGGMHASEQILAALLSRHQTGEGVHLDVSLTDALFAMLGSHDLIYQETNRPCGVDELNGQYVNYSIYETKDGRYVALGALEPHFWSNFCLAVNKHEWVSERSSRHDEESSVSKEIIDLFKSRTYEEWNQFSTEVDCCLSPVLTTDEAITSPLIKERGLIDEELSRVKPIATKKMLTRKE